MNCLELFAGAGGLALGLHQAGFKIVGAVEFDKYACETLRQNDFVEKVIEADITKISNIKDYITEDIDLISGGFLVKHLAMLVLDVDLQIPVVHYSTTMHAFLHRLSLKCSLLKTSKAY